MNKVTNITEYRQRRKQQDRLDMIRGMDELIEWAHKAGVCDTCGALYGAHLTYCKESTNEK